MSYISKHPEHLGIMISEQKFVHDSHMIKSFRSHLGVVSHYHYCIRCQRYLDHNDTDKCITYDRTFLNPPIFKAELVSIVSASQRIIVKSKLKLQMLRYLKRFQKYNLPRYFITGSTTISSEVYSELMNEGLISVESDSLRLNKTKYYEQNCQHNR